MRLVIGLAMAMLGTSAVHAQDESFAMATYREKTRAVRPCPRDPGAIVVCGSQAERNARERIPLPDERDSAERGIVRGEAPRASAARVRVGMCGVNASESAGCNGGLKLVSIGRPDPSNRRSSVLSAVAPTIDEEDPRLLPQIPDRFKGATPP